jgi:hypothetical protein
MNGGPVTASPTRALGPVIQRDALRARIGFAAALSVWLCCKRSKKALAAEIGSTAAALSPGLGGFIVPKETIAATGIFQQAENFYQTLAALHKINPDPHENLHAAVTLVEPLIVLSAITTELFLKCLICIESTGTTPPRDHNLQKLFGKLSVPTRERIQSLWDRDVVPRRREEWDRCEGIGLKIRRDLPSALAKGADAFQIYRYSYEDNTDGIHYYLQDLSELLERVILEMRPEFEMWRRKPVPLPGVSYQ